MIHVKKATRSCLIVVIFLTLLSACQTPIPRPGTDDTIDAGGDDVQAKDQMELSAQQSESAGRTLARVARMSKELGRYQPDKVMEMIRLLESLPSSQLQMVIEAPQTDPLVKAWLELALLIRHSVVNVGSGATAAQQWADNHRGHAVNRAGFFDLSRRYATLFPVPSQVAILLPEEGSLTTAARVIRDGILSAYLEQPGDSVIRFYSSGQTDASAIKAFQRARDDGAIQIVGPLRLDATRAIAKLKDSTTPVLLLNDPHMDTQIHEESTTVVSLALSQTEEAAAIAKKALSQGYTQAIVITPDSDWGERMGAVFENFFTKGDGHVVATAQFNPSENDHSAMLMRLLEIDKSTQRKESLQRRIGIPLTFEPNRRSDFDFIFMAANPSQGRELKPLLRFHNTGNIPVYALGRVYSGKVDRAADQDLNGVVFTTTLWQLQNAGNTDTLPGSVRDGTLGDLYALGLDAWRILPWLPLMQKDPDLRFPGSAGSLQVKANGRMHREPAWAIFSAGRPRPYHWENN